MKHFIITYKDPTCESRDIEGVYCLSLRAAKQYAENNKQAWIVDTVKEVK